MRKLKKSEYFLAAVLGLVAAFPLAVHVPQLPGSHIEATVATTQQQLALDNYTVYRQHMRDYQQATQICEQQRNDGKDVTCPDINDDAAIAQFLSGNNAAATNAATHAAASSSASSTLALQDLTAGEQSLLRRYEHINSCPQSLQQSMPAFYALCQSVLNPFASQVQGFENADQYAASAPAPTLDQIIQANKGVNRMW